MYSSNISNPRDPDYREYTGAKIDQFELIEIERNLNSVRMDVCSDKVARLVKDARRMIKEIQGRIDNERKSG